MQPLPSVSEAGFSAPTDLTNCDREPIHIPGRIQPHGVLLALGEPPGLLITHCSESAQLLLGLDAKPLLGQPLDRAIGDAAAGAVRDHLAQNRNGAGAPNAAVGKDPLFLQHLVVERGPAKSSFAMLLHRHDGRLILELELAQSAAPTTFQNLYALVRDSTATLQRAETLADLTDSAAAEVRRLTGFDRVMVYQFDADWNGKVVAEARGAGVEAYLDQHFPASDIPRQARELYRLNRVRLIADVGYAPSDVLEVPRRRDDAGSGASREDHRPLDLTYAALRSVSPIHLEYLRNMGVGASMSISILREDARGEDRLWGLIACHHREPLHVPYEVRIACDMVGQIVAMQLAGKEHAEDAQHRIELKGMLLRVLENMSAEPERYVRGLIDHPHDLLALASAAGAAVMLDDELHLLGKTPSREEVVGLLAAIGTPALASIKRPASESSQAGSDAEVFATDSLAGVYPAAEAFTDTASGLLAIVVPRARSGAVAWFRPEVVRTITWAGNPAKSVEPEMPEMAAGARDAASENIAAQTGPPAPKAALAHGEASASGAAAPRISASVPSAAPADFGPLKEIAADVRIHPRRSFEAWKQVVHRRSTPWTSAQLGAVAGLRDAIVRIVLRQADELAQLSSSLEKSNRELEAFSYSVSHDLRAPFRHVVGFSDLLLGRIGATLDETDKRYLNAISSAGRNAGMLVDGLLAFSQIGRTNVNLQRVELLELAERVRDELRDAEPQRNIQWRIDLLPAVRGDPVLLLLVVRNLLSNAVKYTRPRDQAEVHVGLLGSDAAAISISPEALALAPPEARDQHVIFVRDNGVGFDMTYAGKLFGVFSRLHLQEEFEGTGVGLANVRRIVERHGGHAWAHAELDRGATFFFSLPKDEERGDA